MKTMTISAATFDKLAAFETKYNELRRTRGERAETLAALETENADLRSEVSRLRNIAAERDALADEVAALQFRKPRTLSRDEVAALMKEGEKIGIELEARFTRMERPDPNAKGRAR